MNKKEFYIYLFNNGYENGAKERVTVHNVEEKVHGYLNEFNKLNNTKVELSSIEYKKSLELYLEGAEKGKIAYLENHYFLPKDEMTTWNSGMVERIVKEIDLKFEQAKKMKIK